MVAARLLAHHCGVGAGRRARPAAHSAARGPSSWLGRATHRRAALGPHRRVRVRAAPLLHCAGTNARRTDASQVRGGCASCAVVLAGCARRGRDRKLCPRSHSQQRNHRASAAQTVCAAPPHLCSPRLVARCRLGGSAATATAADSARRCRRADPPAGAQPQPVPMGRAVNLRGVGVLVLLVPALLLTVLGAHAVRGARGELLQHQAMVRPRCAACADGAAIGCGSRARASCARSGKSAALPTQARPRASHAAVADCLRTESLAVIYVCTYLSISILIHLYPYIYICIHTHTRTHMHTRTLQTRTRTHTHTHTQTQTQA